MIRAHTAAAVRAAEQPLVERGQGPELMRRASHGLAWAVMGLLRDRGLGAYGAHLVILVGSGNNGGDALYAGALLAARGARVTAILSERRRHEPALAALLAAGGRTETLPEPGSEQQAARTAALLDRAAAADVLLDGLLGTGARGGLRGATAHFVARLCKILAAVPDAAERPHGPAVVACDLPSGVDATTGQAHGPVLPATVTVTFGAVKSGLLTAPGEQLAGQLRLVDLGLAGSLPDPDLLRLEPPELAALLPQPAATAHKYTRGVAGVLAGSRRYPGAAVLAVAAATACGPGLVRYFGPAAVREALLLRHPEVVCSAQSPADAHVQAWLVGPGLDATEDTAAAHARTVLASGLPTVIDAGALELVAPALSLDPTLWLLTPHAGELAALFHRHGVALSRAAIEAAPLAAARRAAHLTGATVLLKGPTTVVAQADGAVFTQADGAPSLATAGSGDTLAGLLVALLALTAAPETGLRAADVARTAALAAALHGRLAHTEPRAPVHAGLLAGRIPAVIAELRGSNL